MSLLFSYGMLQRVEVQEATFGRRLSGTPDALPGHTLTSVPIDDPQVAAESGLSHYANVAPCHDAAARVTGVVFDVTTEELALADVYEADAGYVRALLRLASGLDAWVYQCAGQPSTGPEGSR